MFTNVYSFEIFLANRKKANEWTNEGLSHPEVNISQGWEIFRSSSYYDPRDDWEHTRHTLNNPYMNKGHLFLNDLAEYIAMSEEAARRNCGKTGAERQALMNFGLHFLRELIIRDSDPDAEKHKASMKSALAALTDEQYRSFIRNLIVAEAMCFELSTEEDEHQTPSYNGELLTYVHSLIPKSRRSAFRSELQNALQSNINPMATRTSLSAFSRHGYRGVLDIYLNNFVEPSYEAWGKCFRNLVKNGDVEKVTISWSLFNDETQAALLIQDAHRLLSDIAKLGDAKLYGAVWKACKKNDAILEALRTHQAKKRDAADLLTAVCEIRSPKAFNQIWEACDPEVRAISLNYPLRDPIPLLEAVARLKDPDIFERVWQTYHTETKEEVYHCVRELIALLGKLKDKSVFERIIFEELANRARIDDDPFHLLKSTTKLNDVALFRRVWESMSGEKKAAVLQSPVQFLRLACEVLDPVLFLEFWETCRQHAPRAFNREIVDATEIDTDLLVAVCKLEKTDLTSLVLAAYGAEKQMHALFFGQERELAWRQIESEYPTLLVELLQRWHKKPGKALVEWANAKLVSAAGQSIRENLKANYNKSFASPSEIHVLALHAVYSTLNQEEQRLMKMLNPDETKLAALIEIKDQFMSAIPADTAESLIKMNLRKAAEASKAKLAEPGIGASSIPEIAFAEPSLSESVSHINDVYQGIRSAFGNMSSYMSERGLSGRGADDSFIRRKNDFDMFVSLIFDAEKMIRGAEFERDPAVKAAVISQALDDLIRKGNAHLESAGRQFKINGGKKFPGRKIIRNIREVSCWSTQSYYNKLEDIWRALLSLFSRSASSLSNSSNPHELSIIELCDYLRKHMGELIGHDPTDPISEAMNALLQMIALDVQRVKDREMGIIRHSDLRYLLDNLVELTGSGITTGHGPKWLRLPLADQSIGRRYASRNLGYTDYYECNKDGTAGHYGTRDYELFTPEVASHLSGNLKSILEGRRITNNQGIGRYYELRKHFFEVWLKHVGFFTIRSNRLAFIKLFNELLSHSYVASSACAASAATASAFVDSDVSTEQFWYGIETRIRNKIQAVAVEYRITLASADLRLLYKAVPPVETSRGRLSAGAARIVGYADGLLKSGYGIRAEVRVSGQRATGESAAADAADIPAEPEEQIATAAPASSALTAEQIKAKLLSDPIECAAARRREARQARIAKYTAAEEARRQVAISTGDISLSSQPRRSISARAGAAADPVGSASSEYSCEEVDLIEGAACGEDIAEAYSASDYSDGYSA